MTAQIIFLHGASSSGKTTLAHALQAAAPSPFWHLSIDHFRDTQAWPMFRFQTGQDNWNDHRTTFFDGFHRMIAATAAAGNNLIVEHILDTVGWHADLQTLLTPFPVLFVKLDCPNATLAHRETARADRQTGSALRDAATIHRTLTYDLELIGVDRPSINAARVLAHLPRVHRSAFFKKPRLQSV